MGHSVYLQFAVSRNSIILISIIVKISASSFAKIASCLARQPKLFNRIKDINLNSGDRQDTKIEKKERLALQAPHYAGNAMSSSQDHVSCGIPAKYSFAWET